MNPEGMEPRSKAEKNTDANYGEASHKHPRLTEEFRPKGERWPQVVEYNGRDYGPAEVFSGIGHYRLMAYQELDYPAFYIEVNHEGYVVSVKNCDGKEVPLE